MNVEEYYKKALINAKELRDIINENNLEASILKLMLGYKNHKVILTDDEINEMDKKSIKDSPSWGEINGY